MRTFGIIGFPLTHSFSPTYFAKKFMEENITDAEYRIFSIQDPKDFLTLSDHFNICGLNVTIPHKISVIPFLDELSDVAISAGAVNTISFENGIKTGYNTDVWGFEKSLLNFTGDINNITSALILGDGGAAGAVRFVLEKFDIPYRIVSRKQGYLGFHQLTKKIIKNHNLIINTTPVGMYPDDQNAPAIPYEYLTEEHFLYDLIYNPEKTLFLTNGSNRGSKTINGFEMLKLQAEKSWQIWNQP
ncbi:MAG: shikimate dehydrogenase [Saprospiraceae bacterium]|nr:shikimate dehydrogenase [Saprospiraceae bacterium]